MESSSGSVARNYVHDNAGNIVSDKIRTFEYDQNNRLIRVSAGNAVRDYVYLNGEPVAMRVAGDWFWFLNDHLGTPQIMVDSSGAVVWKAAYLPFGRAIVAQADVENNLRFPGQYFDAETGLHYNWHRYYDPSTGRYFTADPIGLAGGINPYVYTQNNPINLTDPLGLMNTATWGQFGTGMLLTPVPGARIAGGVILVGAASYAVWEAWQYWQENTENEEDSCDKNKSKNQRGNPPTGEPNQWVEHPHGKQDRYYGPDGEPKVDIDYGHDHGQGVPHAHNWENGERGDGYPVSVIKNKKKVEE